MKNYNPIQGIVHIDTYDAIVKGKHQPRKNTLINLRRKISNAYNDFEDHIANGDLYDINPTRVTRKQKEALHHSFGSKTQEFNKYLDQLNSLQSEFHKEYCPYCCIFPWSSIDHYLPKEDYPEFSILINNLIPCCDDCNRKKSTNWKDSVSRSVLYLYHDTVPQVQFLYCNLHHAGNSIRVEYRIDIPSSIDANLKVILEKHFNSLGILIKYAEHSNVFITDQVTSAKAVRREVNLPRHRIVNLLANWRTNFITLYGINYWKVALLESMISDSIVLDEIMR